MDMMIYTCVHGNIARDCDECYDEKFHHSALEEVHSVYFDVFDYYDFRDEN